MLKSVPFANAAAIVAGVAYIVCRLLVAIMPGGMFGIMQSWVHTLNLEGLQMTASFSLGSFVWGLLALIVFVWLVSYATITLYNGFAKE